MLPILTELRLLGTSIPVETYGLATFAALLAGIALSYRNARRVGLDPDHVLLGFLLLTPVVMIGAKLFPALVRGDLGATLALISGRIDASDNPAAAVVAWLAFMLMPGGSTLGAAAVGGAGLLAYVRWFRLPLRDVLDTAAPALALGIPLVRSGCLGAGCCYGAPSSLPWAVVYTDPRAQAAAGVPLGVALHPAPIYEALGALALGLYLLWRLGHRANPGEVFAIFLAGYGALRLVLSPLRGDAPALPGALAWAAIACAGVALWFWLRSPRPLAAGRTKGTDFE